MRRQLGGWFPEVIGIRNERWFPLLCQLPSPEKAAIFSQIARQVREETPAIDADCCFIQAADDTDSAGLRCFVAAPLAGLMKGILDRGCVGGKHGLAHCSIRLLSGKCGKKLNPQPGGGCSAISFRSSLVLQRPGVLWSDAWGRWLSTHHWAKGGAAAEEWWTGKLLSVR